MLHKLVQTLTSILGSGEIISLLTYDGKTMLGGLRSLLVPVTAVTGCAEDERVSLKNFVLISYFLCKSHSNFKLERNCVMVNQNYSWNYGGL